MQNLLHHSSWRQVEFLGNGRKLCLSCIRPRELCPGPKCKFFETVPDVLICKQCKDYPLGRETRFSPLNILFCRRTNHTMTSSTMTEVKQALDRYFGKLESGVMESNLSVNLLTCNIETERSALRRPLLMPHTWIQAQG